MYLWASNVCHKGRAYNEPEGHRVDHWRLRPPNKTSDCVHLLKAHEEIKQQQLCDPLNIYRPLYDCSELCTTLEQRMNNKIKILLKSLTMSRGGKSL